MQIPFINLLKKLGMVFVVLLFAPTILARLLSDLAVNLGFSDLMGLLALSGLAFLIREARMPNRREPRAVRGIERTPVTVFAEEDEP